MHSLRSRLLLSHTLPLLLITPLMGIVLIYVLESQVILVNLSTQLLGQATLIADMAGDHPEIWTTPVKAQEFANRFNQDVTAQLMLLHPDGRLWVSSNPSDAHRLGQVVPHPGLPTVRTGTATIAVNYSQDLRTEIADAVAPVLGPSGQVVGIIRLTHELASVYQRFQRLRYFIAGILIPGLLIGVVIGLILAITLKQPLEQMTQVLHGITSGDQLTTLPEQGPTEMQVVAQAFNLLVGRLQSLESARRQLLANLVHEIGRPLAALRSATYALQRGACEDEELRTRLLSGIEGEVQRLNRLLDDLTRLHDQMQGPLPLKRQPTDLGTWLSILLSPWQQVAHQKGLAWQVHLSDELPTLLIDRDRLGQALGNLLSNAIKYTPGGGSVTVVAENSAQQVCLRVSDSGPGIAGHEHARIFEPFYRSQTHHRFPQGMGLGLTIARDLVQAHGGQLVVESRPGHGSHFTICLPVPPA